MKFIYKKEFLKRFSSYSASEQKLIFESDQQIKAYYSTQNAPCGLRIKKIGPKTFEARVTDKIRMIWIKENDAVYFVLLGSHDEVRRFIKNA